MWAVIKIIEGLNGFIGRQFFITFFAIPIGIFAGIVILLRMFLEEFANRVYTWRINKVATDYLPQRKAWHFAGFVVEVIIATYFAYKFSNWNYYLGIALIIGFLPKLVRLAFDQKIPTSKWINYLIPKGLLLTIVLIYSANTFQSLIRSRFDNSSDFLLWWIVISSIPVFVFGFIKLFAKTGVHPLQLRPVSKYFWRIGSIILYFALIFTILEFNSSQFIGMIGKVELNVILQNISQFFGLK